MIPMQQNFDFSKVQFLFPCTDNIEKFVSHKSFAPFDDVICSFLNEVSLRVMKDSEAKLYSDVITFGFFCRKSSVGQMKKS